MKQARLAFTRSMDRVDALIELHSKLHGKRGKPPQAVSDILRGTLVLAFAALDALVTDCVGAAVPVLAKKGLNGGAVEDWAKKNPKTVLACLAEKAPLDAFCQAFEEGFLEKTTFQKAQAIERALSEVLDCAMDWDAAADRLNSDQFLRVNWDRDRVKARLNHYGARRDRIVHEGDLKPQKHTANPIRKQDVKEAVGVIRSIGETLMDVTRSVCT